MSYFSKATSFLKKHKIYFIVGFVFLIIISSVMYYLTGRNKTEQAVSSAQVKVTKGDITVTVSGTGTIEPIDSEEITPIELGKVKTLSVKNGDYIKAGDLIAEIDSDSLQIASKKAKLEVEKARYSLDNSSSQKSQETIKAPFAGRITSLEIKNSDEVSKNTVLAVLQNDSQLIFDMPISGAVKDKIKPNQAVNVFLVDRGEYVAGKVISNEGQTISGYNGESRSNVKVGISATGNLAPGLVVFGSITINGQQIDALATSKLEFLGDTQIKAGISGEATVHVKEGQVVKEGQILFSLKNDEAYTEKLGLQIAYEQAKLNLEDVQSQQKDLTINAPISGVLTGLNISIGDDLSSISNSKSTSSSNTTTTENEKTFGKIINSAKMTVAFPVDEVDITKVKLGQKAKVTLDALPKKNFEGTVTEIAEEGVSENNVSSFDVTILIENNDALLKSGMTADVAILTNQKKDTLLIPIEALQHAENGEFVLLPAATGTDAGTDARPTGARGGRKKVEVGLTNESYAEILDGLKEGDTILLNTSTSSTQNQQSGMRGFGGGPVGGNATRIRMR